MLLVLLPFHYYVDQQDYIGVPAILVTLIVVAGALGGGPRVGGLLAILGGVSYEAFVVMDHWQVPGVTTAMVLVLWLGAGLAGGCWATAIAGRSRERSTRRTSRADALTGWSGRRRCSTPGPGRPPVARAIRDVSQP